MDDSDGFNIDSRCDLVVGAHGEVRLGLGDQPAQVTPGARRAEQRPVEPRDSYRVYSSPVANRLHDRSEIPDCG